MASQLTSRFPDVIRLQNQTFMSGLLMGGGFAYAEKRQAFWHFPIVFLVPSAYAGYQMFQTLIPQLTTKQLAISVSPPRE